MNKKPDLTAKQEKVCTFIWNEIRKKGTAPTYREIARFLHVDVRSAYQHVLALERKGLISRIGGRRKKLTLLPEMLPGSGVPICGRVPAGPPSEAQQDITRFLNLQEIALPDDVYALTVKGDSMEAGGILDGDYVIVRRSGKPLDGSIVVASVDGESTVKTFRRKEGKPYLLPQNREGKYPPIPLEGREVVLGGTVQWVVRKVRR